MKKAVVVQPDGKWEIVEFDDSNGLAVLQKAVDGLIQPVDINPVGITMWVNEEGLYRFDFTENFMASAIFEESHGENATRIMGPAVYTGGTDHKGYTNGLSDKHLELIVEMAKFAETAMSRLNS
jgi:hypothetical protein